MRYTTNRAVAAAVVSTLGLTFVGGSEARGQVTVDGTRDASGYTQVAVQTINTGFGDSNNILGGNGSELDNLSYNVDLANGKLNLFLGGNLETNNNKLVIFLDTYAGGQNVIRNDNADVNFNNLNFRYGPQEIRNNGVPTSTTPGFTFDTGFNADHFISLSRDAGNGIDTFGNVYVDYAQLRTNGGGRGGYVGKVSVIGVGTDQSGNGAPAEGDLSLLPMTVGLNDNNTAGVNGNTGTAADQTAAAAVNTGTELSLDLAALGIEGDFKIVAFINGQNHDFLSNQILAGFEVGQVNLGSDGANHFVSLGTDPDGPDTNTDPEDRGGTSSLINLNNFAGNQFVSVPVTIPTIAYSSNANGNYSNGANFTGGVVPNGVNGRVLFGNAITAPRTVTVDTDVSLIRMTFDSASSYTLSGTNTITITGIAATPAVRSLSGAHTVGVPVTLQNDAMIETAAGSSLTFTQPLSAAGKNLFKIGGGTLTLAPTNVNSVTVDAGTLAFSGSGNTVLKGVTVGAGATLDLKSSKLIVDYDEGYSPRDAIKALLADGRLKSTTAGAGRAIGYADTAAAPALTSYNGTPLDATALVFAQTLVGDADLSMNVAFSDLLALAKNYNGTNKQWYNGDFDYDGDVDFGDLLGLAKNYNKTLSASQADVVGSAFAADFALAQSLVPEPTLAFAGLMGGATLLGRRRK